MAITIRTTIYDPDIPIELGSGSKCELALDRGRKRMQYSRLEEPAPADGTPSTTKPYIVEFIVNPAAWGASPNTKPISFEIPRAPTEMHRVLRLEADGAYCLGGWPLVEQLTVGVFGLQQFSDVRRFRPGQLDRRRTGSARVDMLRTHVSEDRRELFDTWGKVRGELVRRVSETASLLESFAVCRAITKELPACELSAIEEGRRYLSLASDSDDAVRAAILHPHAKHTQALIGPEGRDLVRAIRRLVPSSRGLRAAREAFTATLPRSRATDAAKWLAVLGPLGLPLAIAQAKDVVAETFGPDDVRESAASSLARAGGEFQERFVEAALKYPILFKIGDSLEEDELQLRTRVLTTLKTAVTSSRELARVLGEDAEKVWRFPGLIERSVRQGFAADSAFVSRVAAEKLSTANEMPVFARLNCGIQLMSTSLMLVPAPPVKLAILIASVAGDTAELLESYFRTAEQKLGFAASIDPGLALGSDNSYVSTVLQAGFIAVGILPIPGAVKEWAEDSAAASKAAALREAVLAITR